MLINESRFTPLSYNIKNQIKRIINSFVNNYISKKGKLSNLSPEEAKKSVKKMIGRSKYKAIHVGNINLGKAHNREIPIFISDTGGGGAYIEEDDYHNEHIIISFNAIFIDLEATLSILAHELIHAMQPYKKSSTSYDKVASKIVNSEELTAEENFIYYTEPKEFEANATQLAYIISKFYERKDVNKEKVLFLLDLVLKFPKQRMYKFFHSFYIRYLMNLSNEEQELLSSYMREMFMVKLEFIKSIANPPDNKSVNIKKSNRYWKQFKSKLFNLVQNLKKRHLKHQEKNK